MHGAHAPFLLGHRIERDAAEEFEFLARHIDAVDQGIKIGRIALASELGDERVHVGGSFVAIDGVADHPEVVAEFPLALALDGVDGQWERGPDENHHDRGGDDEFDQGEAA